ncbi:DgyrCDS1454 [Dimorphilus gyrociliatus]|uniref:DgyrCDS1454 n=1 Tax=Dimorphilus gyrociliatus TaxID=2664684 RepID=A0A7I8VAJ7_9ANNE|nr:DgyrCDS1454 [Dimorphilus gyrociliatus]
MTLISRTRMGSKQNGRIITQTKNFQIDHNLNRVKPNSVKDIVFSDVQSNSMIIEWQHKRYITYNIAFELTMHPLYDETDKKVILLFNNYNYTAKHLLSYTIYKLSMRCRTFNRNGTLIGYWSDKTTVNADRTKNSRPSEPLRIVGLKFTKCFDYLHCLIVELFTNPIPRRSINGPIQYCYYKRDTSNNEEEVAVKFQYESTSVRFSIDERFSHKIDIWCENDIGKSPINELFIPINKEILPPLKIEADFLKNETKVKISWTYQQKPDKILLIYCKGISSVTGCKNFVEYQDISDQTSPYIWRKPNRSVHYLVALNYQIKGKVVSMTDWICIYRENAVPITPDISLLDSTEHSLTIIWEKPKCNSKNSRPVKYFIYLRTVNDIKDLNVTLSSSYTNFTFNNLTPFTNYSIHIQAKSDSGFGVFSNELLVTTDSATPEGPPDNITIVNLNANSITVKFDPPKRIYGQFIGYEVKILIKKVKNDAEYSNYSKLLTFHTGISAARPLEAGIVKLRLHSGNDNKALVEWNEPKFSNGPIRGYKIEIIGPNYQSSKTVSYPKTSTTFKIDCKNGPIALQAFVKTITYNFSDYEFISKPNPNITQVDFCTSKTTNVVKIVGLTVSATVGILFVVWFTADSHSTPDYPSPALPNDKVNIEGNDLFQNANFGMGVGCYQFDLDSYSQYNSYTSVESNACVTVSSSLQCTVSNQSQPNGPPTTSNVGI